MASDMPAVLEKQKVFREYFSYFNFLRAIVVSKEAGVDRPTKDYDTALGAYRLGTIQGHVAVDPSRVAAVLAEMPQHDGQSVVFVKRGILGTGTDGIATIGGRDNGTFIHELGHSFAGLGDEYTVEIHRRRSQVRTRPNVSATEDPDQVPWKHFLEARVRGVDVYEGADGRPRGAFKPTSRNCVMDNGALFCPVCREAIVLTIYRYVDPIDSTFPFAHPFDMQESIHGIDHLEFEVTVLQPREHRLEVSWYVVQEQAAPATPEGWENGSAGQDRINRGPLSVIAEEPVKAERARNGKSTFVLDTKELGKGRFRIVCRVRDDTRVKGDRNPWVIADPADLLESERGWWIRVE
jgi:hypothetical protein